MIRRPSIALLLALAACGDRGAPSGPAAPAVPSFELREVVAERADSGTTDAPAPLADALVEELRGLCSLAAGDDAMLRIAREDVARLPEGAERALADAALDAELSDAERAAALDLIDVEGAHGADVLADLAASATRGTPAWVRARAAWRLSQGGPDHVVPALLQPLKYDKDHETVVWLATALARRANYSGIDGLIAITRVADSPAMQNAQYQLNAILQEVGLESVDELWRAWRSGDPEGLLPHPVRSERYRGEVWRWIGRLNEFQLRGVDDARFILERMDRDAAAVLAEALHERDVHVRVHVAQCLQRMGPRGVVAGPELVRGLAEPELAPHAAIALGRIGYAPALAPLRERLGSGTSLDLRLASARALGFLGDPAAAPDLRALFDAEPAELAQASAESVALLDADARDAAERLLAWIEDPRVEPSSSERALRGWLYERGADDVIARWDELATPVDAVETLAEARARRAERVALVRAYLAG